jgi:hypothetical protein
MTKSCGTHSGKGCNDHLYKKREITKEKKRKRKKRKAPSSSSSCQPKTKRNHKKPGRFKEGKKKVILSNPQTKPNQTQPNPTQPTTKKWSQYQTQRHHHNNNNNNIQKVTFWNPPPKRIDETHAPKK